MKYSNILLFVFVLSVFHLVNRVLTMDQESISGGHPARPRQLRYQATILRKKNRSDTNSVAGSGAFISVNLILGAAQIFVFNNGDLQEYHYSIVADSILWTRIRGIHVVIELIYLPSGGNYYWNDVAVAKLNDDFNIYNYPGLSALDIAKEDESFYERTCVVSGSGALLPSDLVASEGVEELISDVSGILSYASVSIASHTRCALGTMPFDINKQFCGVMLTDKPGQTWGICENDAGSPLVYENKIVGIAGTNNLDCDDTVNGHAYMKVSRYSIFIKSIIDKTPLPGTLIRHNRPHISAGFPLAAPAA